MAQRSGPKPGSKASIKSLERMFGKKFNIEEEEQQQSSTPHSHQPPPNKRQRNKPRPTGTALEAIALVKKSWTGLTVPQYPGMGLDFVASQIGFTGFIKDLERMNGDVLLPLYIVGGKWRKMIGEKYEEWEPVDARVTEEERVKRMRDAKSLSSRKTYQAYRIETLGADKWEELELEMNSKVTLINRESRKARTERKRADRVSKKGGMAAIIALANKKKPKKKQNPRHKEVMMDPIGRRLRSTTQAPDLPPLDRDAVAGVVPALSPGCGLGADVEMEL